MICELDSVHLATKRVLVQKLLYKMGSFIGRKEKILMLGKIEGRRKREQQRMR